MARVPTSRTTRLRQILLAALAAVWLVGGAILIVRLEMREVFPGGDRASLALRLGALLAQLLVAVFSTALLLWITFKRRSERREQQRAEEFRQLFHDATEAMFVADAGLVILEINDAGVRLTGFPRAELLGRALPALLSAEELAARPLKMDELNSGRRIESERLVRRRSGESITVEFSVQKLPDGRILGVVRDISRRRAIEQRLRLLSRAVDESPAAMVITGISGRIEYVNPRFSRVTGWSATEALGQSPAILASGRTEPAVYAEMWETILAGREWRGELTNRRKNGELFPWLLSIHPIVDGHGTIEYFLGVGEDATERREAERTLEDTRSELFQAQKMEALGRLAGGVAHDFNNLLSIILGYSDLVGSTLPAGSEGSEQLGEVRKAVLRATDLTRQLLAFSRRQVLAVRVIALSVLLEDSRKMLSRLLPENIELQLEVEPGLWSVRADSTQLVQVLINLAINSRDAMPQGGRLLIAARNAPLDDRQAEAHGLPPGDHVCLRVNDTGVGMTPDVLAHAFEPFFTTKASAGGTGLGLATVYGIVQQLGGCAEIESSPTQGTTLAIFLPRSREPLSGEVALPPQTAEKAVQGTILVVEDLAPLRKLVERMLLQIGYRVLSASSAQEAIDLAGEGGLEIDLLLSDIVMPGMDGRTLARRLREVRPSLRIVLMTGYADLLAETSDPAELGADAVVQKPFSRLQIERLLADVLAGSGSNGKVS